MTVDQILLQEIKDSELWLSRENEKSIYKRDIKKRIEEKDRYFATLDIDCFADNTRQAIRYLSELDEWQSEKRISNLINTLDLSILCCSLVSFELNTMIARIF